MRQTVLTFIFGREQLLPQPRGVDGASLLTCDSKHVSVTAGTNIHVISPYFNRIFVLIQLVNLKDVICMHWRTCFITKEKEKKGEIKIWKNMNKDSRETDKM